MLDGNKQDDRTAVHEAGHAVVGRMCGMLCGGVTIEPDEDGASFSITADPHAIQWHYEQLGRFILPDKIMRHRIYTFMAGAEAENLFFGNCGGGDGDDRLQIGMMVSEIAEGPDQVDALESRLRQEARSCVRWCRGRIRRLAESLVIERTIAADRVDEIIGYVQPKPALSPQELQTMIDETSVSITRR